MNLGFWVPILDLPGGLEYLEQPSNPLYDKAGPAGFPSEINTPQSYCPSQSTCLHTGPSSPDRSLCDTLSKWGLGRDRKQMGLS